MRWKIPFLNLCAKGFASYYTMQSFGSLLTLWSSRLYISAAGVSEYLVIIDHSLSYIKSSLSIHICSAFFIFILRVHNSYSFFTDWCLPHHLLLLKRRSVPQRKAANVIYFIILGNFLSNPIKPFQYNIKQYWCEAPTF